VQAGFAPSMTRRPLKFRGAVPFAEPMELEYEHPVPFYVRTEVDRLAIKFAWPSFNGPWASGQPVKKGGSNDDTR